MKTSHHQYSHYAPLKADNSYGVMGLSQISMNHAVKELLLKKYAAKWISGERWLHGDILQGAREDTVVNQPLNKRSE